MSKLFTPAYDHGRWHVWGQGCMSQADPIRCLNGFFMGVKVQNVPSDMEKESIFMGYRTIRQHGKAGYWPFQPGLIVYLDAPLSLMHKLSCRTLMVDILFSQPCVCVCVCVRERERERERGSAKAAVYMWCKPHCDKCHLSNHLHKNGA